MFAKIEKCPSCGAAWKHGARFCVKCGQPLAVLDSTSQNSPAAPPPLPPQSMQSPAENIPSSPRDPSQTPPPAPVSNPSELGYQNNPVSTAPAPEYVIVVIGKVTRKTGIFSSDLYHLVITDRRLIFARQTKEMQSADVQRAREQAKREGKNLLGQVGAQMSSQSGDKYLEISPDLILSENPQNFFIPLEQVLKINTYHGDFEDNNPDSMEVITPTEKYKFLITNYFNTQKQLKAALGTKVK